MQQDKDGVSSEELQHLDPIAPGFVEAVKPRPEPWLIAHVVRGEPAFDVAIQMEVEGYVEPWWIIPTSGHRAYPYWQMKLEDVWAAEAVTPLRHFVPPPPPGWRDHYETARYETAQRRAPVDIDLSDLEI